MVFPVMSRIRAFFGTAILLRGPAATILPPCNSTAESFTSGLPVPSTSVAPTRAIVSCVVLRRKLLEISAREAISSAAARCTKAPRLSSYSGRIASKWSIGLSTSL